MKKLFLSFLLLFFYDLQLFSADTNRLEEQFKKPPTEYRPYVWWHWMGSNFSKEGITKDLEAMKDSGIGGATVFNITSAVQESQSPMQNNPWPNQTYRSRAYWDALRHAAAEADRLGLELGLHNTVGYSTTGGPWISESEGMKNIVWSTVRINGGKTISVTLPPPAISTYNGWGSVGRKASKFDDIAVFAIPDSGIIKTENITDLTRMMDDEGNLKWDAPSGWWKIIRICSAATMSCPHPAPDELIGKVLEVDKMNAELSRLHWDNVLRPFKENLGEYVGKTFRHVLIDSYEAGNQNWTDGFRETFVRQKGYDPLPWMPLLTKREGESMVIGSLDETKRFEWDYSDVIAYMYQVNGWEEGKDAIASYRMDLQMEPYWGPFNTMAGAAIADLPMGEFWANGDGKIEANVPAGGRAAGKTVIGAEAYTGFPTSSMWTEDPAYLKKSTDGAFASGVNRMILHHWVHQPFDDKYQPGMGMGWWGTHFNRHQTWYEPGKAFFQYLGRSQFLLQQGEQVIDFLSLDKVVDFNSDGICSMDFLRWNIEVEDRKIVLPSGRSYSLMIVPESTSMLPEVLDKIDMLLGQGAVIVSGKPQRSPSLKDYPYADERLQQKADEIWNSSTLPKYKTGFVFTKLQDAIRYMNLTPDYFADKTDVSVVHRSTGKEDIYYVANLGEGQQTVNLSLRVNGKLPELWNAEDGSISVVKNWRFQQGRTIVQLDLQPNQSRFIVFRRTATNKEIEDGGRQKPAEKIISKEVINGAWEVSFAPKLGEPFQRTFNELIDFSQHSEKEIKYFSGTATYRKKITMSSNSIISGNRVMLRLGEMNDIASVKINGRTVKVLWYPPYDCDITEALKTGENELEIAVTNNWANRLIGDEKVSADFEWGIDRGVDYGRAMKGYPKWFLNNQPRPQQERKGFTIWYYFRPDSALQKAGLVGPVQVEILR